jgi:S-(hydroxymethyl)glutathione dehydrogenase/alcohol dehydrogenase
VVAGSAVLPLPQGVALEQAALLGCAMVTGVGAVLNSARVAAGESVAVFGTGGVGLAAIQGARLAGADPIIAIDLQAAKEERARRNGATHFVGWRETIAKEVRALTGGRGVDHAFECVGSAKTIRAAWSSTRRGGRTTVVGIGPADQRVEFNPLELFYFARTLAGCVMGSSDIAQDLPRLLAAVERGELHPEQLVSDRIHLEDIPAAFAQMQAGGGARSLVVF